MNVEALKNLDPYLQSIVDKGEVAGCALAVISEGEEVYRKEFGMANIEENMKMSRDTIFRCYSMTKPITNIAVMTLVEKGLIVLSDPVSKYLPGFKNQRIYNGWDATPVKHEITLQNLLDMTAGIGYPDASYFAGIKLNEFIDKFYSDLYDKGIELSTVEFANKLGELPLEFEPGTRWRYGLCADVLGAVVSQVTGMSYGDYLKKTIFEPLGMKDTDFYVPEEKLDRFSQSYILEEDGLKPWSSDHMLGLTHNFLKKPGFESGGAGLVSTVDDYEKIIKLFLNEGELDGVRIFSRSSAEFMQEDHLTDENRASYDWEALKGYGYGNLMRHMIKPHENGSLGNEGEYGWDGFLGTYMFVDPAEDLGIVFVIQKFCGNGYRDIQVIRDIVYGAVD
ncbi:MAG: beta-lactamase family protein [Lachnospiraceae bacterium]|nr:beta-lactamase family protein [Lachnospiraceae bacterium]